jgi:hypothetical protein
MRELTYTIPQTATVATNPTPISDFVFVGAKTVDHLTEEQFLNLIINCMQSKHPEVAVEMMFRAARDRREALDRAQLNTPRQIIPPVRSNDYSSRSAHVRFEHVQVFDLPQVRQSPVAYR